MVVASQIDRISEQEAGPRQGQLRPAKLAARITPDLIELAPRIIWFEPPETALAKPVRFLAYLMIYGTEADVAVARRHFTDEDFAEALANAPPGIFDPRSWSYWNLMAGRYPPPPMPVRVFPED
jgi:hypothetical protein